MSYSDGETKENVKTQTMKHRQGKRQGEDSDN